MPNPFRIKYRELSVEEQKKIVGVKKKFTELWDLLDTLGGSADMMLAKRKLEESCMWAVKHLTA